MGVRGEVVSVRISVFIVDTLPIHRKQQPGEKREKELEAPENTAQFKRSTRVKRKFI